MKKHSDKKNKPLRETSRSSCSMFFKIGVLKNFVNFIGKHLCWSFVFNKVAGLEACSFIKKEIPTQLFSYENC